MGPERLAAILDRAENGFMDEWATLCDRMVEVDADARSSYETRLAAIAGARHYFEAGSPTGDAARDARSADAVAFVERAINSIVGLEVAVQESLDGIGKGLGAHEIGWVVDNGVVVPERLHWVHARRFRYDPDTWELRLVDNGETVSAMGEPLQPDGWLVHQPKTVAGYPTRIGVLRACAWPYLFRRWALQFWVQGAESYAWPFMYAEIPRQATAEVRAEALAGLETMTQERRGVIEVGGAFKLLETTVKDGGTWDGLFRSLGGEIKKAILGMTDLNEPGRIGAYAAVEVRRGTTVDARIAMDERALSTTWTQQLIEPLVRFNAHLFGGVIPPIPRIRWSVSASRKEIPAHLLDVCDENEKRASIDLDPRPKRIEATVPADGVDSLMTILTSVGAGTISPIAAIVALRNVFPSMTADDALALIDAQAALKPAAPAPAPTSVLP
jgi:phage gp29-like protein